MSRQVCDELSNGLLANAQTFLGKNVVWLGLDSQKGVVEKSTRRFDFSKLTTQVVQGGSIYQPTAVGSGHINGSLKVTYLPWAPDAGYYVILEPNRGPDIMFTAMLSGCAVGYVRANDGAVRVSHHNIQGTDETDEPAQINSLGFAAGTFHRSEYRSASVKVKSGWYVKKEGYGFVFGVRTGGVWHMYAQAIESKTKQNLQTAASISAVSILDVHEI